MSSKSDQRHLAQELFEQGRIAMRAENWEAAAIAFERSFELMPSADAARHTSYCLAWLHRDEEALAWLLKALALSPRDADLAYEVAEEYAKRAQPGEAMHYLKQALLIKPHHAMSLDLLNKLQGRGDMPELDTTDRDSNSIAYDEALALHHHGWRLLRENRWQEALPYFQASFSKSPTVGAACQASKCLSALGRHDEALSYLLQALEINPRQADVAMTIAREYERRGQPSDALRFVRQALSVNPQHGPALRMQKSLDQTLGGSA